MDTIGRAQSLQFYVSTGAIASTVRRTSDKRLWAQGGLSTSESGKIIQSLLHNSFFHVKHETTRTMSIFLNLLDKYSPHSRDVADFLIAANALDLGAKLATADQGFNRYPEVDVHALYE